MKKPDDSQANKRIEYEDIKVTNNFHLSRRQVYPRYQSSFVGHCNICFKFAHKAISCREPKTITIDDPRNHYNEKNNTQNQNSFSVLTQEIEC